MCNRPVYFVITIAFLYLILAACNDNPETIRRVPTLPALATATPTLAGFQVVTPTPPLPRFTVEVRYPTEFPTPPLKPSPTPPPTPTYRPTATPVGQLPVLPPYPSNKPDEAVKVTATWLNAQPDARPKDSTAIEIARDRLKTLLLGWKATGQGVPIEIADLDANGEVEIVTTIVDNWREPGNTINDRGSVMVLSVKEGRWNANPALRSTLIKPQATEDFNHPVLLKVDDLNKDGKPEIVFSETLCGATTCFITVQIVNWQSGKWIDLAPQSPTMPAAEISFDYSGDGTVGVVLFGGASPVTGAGLQRQRTEYHRWDSATKIFKLGEIRYETSPYLFYRLVDGNFAGEKGDYIAALRFYNDGLTTTNLKLWARERNLSAQAINDEKISLTAFIRFRFAVTHALLGEKDKTMALLRESIEKDGVYAGWAQSFEKVYSAKGDIKEACNAVIAFTEQNKKLLDPLNQFGSANPPFTPQAICPFIK
jgi:hypothetical protein